MKARLLVLAVSVALIASLVAVVFPNPIRGY